MVPTHQHMLEITYSFSSIGTMYKGFIHSDQLFEPNDIIDHKSKLKSYKRVLSCFDHIKRKYISALPDQPIHEENEDETGRVADETDSNNSPTQTKVTTDILDQRESSDLPSAADGKNKEKEPEWAPSIQKTDVNTGNESKRSSITSVSNVLSKGEASKDKEENAATPISQVTEPNTADDDSHNSPSTIIH